MRNYQVHWRYVTPTSGSYQGSEVIYACNEDEALEHTIRICREKGLNNYTGKLTIINTEI
jgi:hypothetical protein